MNFKSIVLKIIIISLTTALTVTMASPMRPWEQNHCSGIRQNDDKKIGAICGSFDSNLQVNILDVYYFGYLWQNESKYNNFYSNLSLDGSQFIRRSFKRMKHGDGTNLPIMEVLFATYIVSTHFTGFDDYPKGKLFQIYFQAEQIQQINYPPFSYDNLYGDNYRGTLGRRR